MQIYIQITDFRPFPHIISCRFIPRKSHTPTPRTPYVAPPPILPYKPYIPYQKAAAGIKPAAAYPHCAEICFLSRQLQRYCRKPGRSILNVFLPDKNITIHNPKICF